MTTMQAFLCGLAIAIGLGFAVVWYVKFHLRGILIDLCGTEQRADFWMAFSNIALIIVPIVFAIGSPPASTQAPVFLLFDQLKWALVGEIGTVAALGIVLARFIRSGSRMASAKL